MRTASAVLAIAMAAGLAQGDLIIGNLTASPFNSTIFGINTTSQFKAVGFTMGADAYDVTSATLAFEVIDPTANPVLSIWDGATGPVNELMVFNNPVLAVGIADLTWTAPSSFTLQPNTTYWLHIRSEPIPGGQFRWFSTSTANPPTGPGATWLQYNFNGNNSTTYNRFNLEGNLAGGGCEPDLTTGAIAGQPGYGVPNGVLNNDDFFYYLALFAANDIRADLTTGAIAGQPGYGVPNGVINNDDFFYYLALFAAGC